MNEEELLESRAYCGFSDETGEIFSGKEIKKRRDQRDQTQSCEIFLYMYKGYTPHYNLKGEYVGWLHHGVFIRKGTKHG